MLCHSHIVQAEGQIDQLQHNVSDSFFFLVCVLQFSSHVAHNSHVHKPVFCCTVCHPFSFSSPENVFLVTCIRLMATFYAFIFCQVHFEEQKFSTIQTSYDSETWGKRRIVNWSQICQTYLKNGYRLSVIKCPYIHAYKHRFYSASSLQTCPSKKCFLKSEHYTDFYTTMFLQFITVYLYTWIEPSCWT
jgi:hypothetical protein